MMLAEYMEIPKAEQKPQNFGSDLALVQCGYSATTHLLCAKQTVSNTSSMIKHPLCLHTSNSFILSYVRGPFVLFFFLTFIVYLCARTML